MPSYEELKKELAGMSEILKQYPESLQPQVFRLLLQKYLGEDVTVDEGSTGPTSETPQGTQQPGAKKKSLSKETYRILGDLNLLGANGVPSFRAFYEEKHPRTNQEFNTIAVYYLERTLKLPAITLDHVYTCYKDVSRKVPTAFKQSLYDTSSRIGSIDAKDMNKIALTIRGENLVEHDLPPKGIEGAEAELQQKPE